MLTVEAKNKMNEFRLMLTALIMCSTLMPVQADDLLGTLLNKAEDLYAKLAPLVIVVAVIALIICALFYFTSKDPRKADEAFQWGKRILFGALVVAIAPRLLIEIVKLFGDGMTGSSLDDLEDLVND